MMRGVLTVLSFVSLTLFPWPATVLLALSAGALEPLIPLVLGIAADTLYYSHASGGLPLFSLWGAVATAILYFVHSQLRTGIIER